MKKFLAYFVVILFAGILSLSFIAFTNNPIKHRKAEPAVITDTIKAKCAHQEAAATATETKACCQEAGKTESGECAHAATCKHHNEKVAEAK